MNNQKGFALTYFQVALALGGIISAMMISVSNSGGVSALTSGQKGKASALIGQAAILRGTVGAISSDGVSTGIGLQTSNSQLIGISGSAITGATSYVLPPSPGPGTTNDSSPVWALAQNTYSGLAGTYGVVQNVVAGVCTQIATQTQTSIVAMGTASAGTVPTGINAQSVYSVAWPDAGCVQSGSTYNFVFRLTY